MDTEMNEKKNTLQTSFDVQLKPSEMFWFLLNHTYRKLINIILVVFSIAVVVVVILTWGKVQLYQSILLLVFACLFTIVNPIMLWFKALRQIKRTPSLQKPLHYAIDENGVTVSLEDLSESTAWGDIWKAVRYGSIVLIYVTNVRVFNIPVRCLTTEQYNTLVACAKQGLMERCHLKSMEASK